MVVGYYLKGDQVLLGLRKETEWGIGKDLLAGIGGKVGDLPGLEDETEDEAFIRESQEEINVTPLKFRGIGYATFLFPAKPKWNQRVRIYLVDAWEGEPTETESIRPEWHDINQLPFDQMWDDAHYYLAQALAGKAIDATFTYSGDNRTVHHIDIG